MENENMTVMEMAKYLRICRTTAYKLVKTPGFPAMRVLRDKYIIPKAELDRWIAERSGNEE